MPNFLTRTVEPPLRQICFGQAAVQLRQQITILGLFKQLATRLQMFERQIELVAPNVSSANVEVQRADQVK